MYHSKQKPFEFFHRVRHDIERQLVLGGQSWKAFPPKPDEFVRSLADGSTHVRGKPASCYDLPWLGCYNECFFGLVEFVWLVHGGFVVQMGMAKSNRERSHLV
jgi:hypothetical protein